MEASSVRQLNRYGPLETPRHCLRMAHFRATMECALLRYWLQIIRLKTTTFKYQFSMDASMYKDGMGHAIENICLDRIEVLMLSGSSP